MKNVSVSKQRYHVWYALGLVSSGTRTSVKNIATSRTDTTKVLPDPETPENQAVNHINTTASLSDPETPEDERKNVFGGNYLLQIDANWLQSCNCWYECFVMQR